MSTRHNKTAKVRNVPACFDTCVDFLPVSSVTTHEWLATARLMKSRGAAGVSSEDKRTEVKTGVRFPKQTPFCEVISCMNLKLC